LNEGQWVESSKVLTLYGRKNYVRNEFYRRAEHSYEKVKGSQKEFKKLKARADMKEVHVPKRVVRNAIRI